MPTGGADGGSASLDERVRSLVAEGAELYNGGAFWEAHEAWEEGWHLLREEGEPELADLLQGLILATAAFENLQRGKPNGFATQGAKALARLRHHEGLGSRLGLTDEGGFREELLTVYLDVQRHKIEHLDDLGRQAPALEVSR